MKKTITYMFGLFFLISVWMIGKMDVSADCTGKLGRVTMETYIVALAGSGANVVCTVEEGQPVLLTGEDHDGYYSVNYAGKTGYIPKQAVADWQSTETILSYFSHVEAGEPLKINVLGDSITYGDKLASQEYSYASILKTALGAEILRNYGWNGSAIAGNHPDRFVDRVSSMDRDANVIIVFGGTNDYCGHGENGTELGSMGDMSTGTFYGGLTMMYVGLKQRFPDSDIIYMTPIKRKGYMRTNNQGYNLQDYVNASKEVADLFGIPVLDLFNEPELDFSSSASVYLVDGLHPNRMGHAILASVIYQRLYEALPK